MRKQVALLLGAVMTAGLITGCGGGKAADPTTTAAPETKAETQAEAPESKEEATEAETKEEAAAASGDLNIYTTVSDLQYNAIVGAFQEKYPDIKISYTQAGAGECKTRIQQRPTIPRAT